MKSKWKYIGVIALFILCISAISVYALTEDEVKAAVDAKGKEGVSGNILVWFLCALAFMKVSQKIDTFMSSLGISVGRTGGAMMGEAMIVARAFGGMMRGGRAAFGKGGAATQAGGKPAGPGGIFGIGRKMTDAAVGNVTGNNTNSIMSSIGKKAYENSINKGGSFATSVISSVARGEIKELQKHYHKKLCQGGSARTFRILRILCPKTA